MIDEDGSQLGIMTSFQALQLAKEKETDLVEVAPLANPPVCKIVDYGKLQYHQSKMKQNSKAKQKKVEVKGIRIGFRTDVHDLEFKKNQAEKFLKKGNRVKIEIRLRGREKAHQHLAQTNLDNFLKSIRLPYKKEQEIKRMPGGFDALIVPEE